MTAKSQAPPRSIPTLSRLVLVFYFLMAGPSARVFADDRAQRLNDVSTWQFQLQGLTVEGLARVQADMLVIDTERAPEAGGVFTRAEIDRLRRREGARDRLIIAYLSIGEAETYRSYWLPGWHEARPSWMLEENCRWPSNYLVRFWEDDWKDIIFRGPGSYLDRILDAGFDGVYLDRVDVYWDIRKSYPSARTAMAQFVGELAARARAARPGFLVIAQNAELLLSDPDYRAVIDAVAKEDLLYGMRGTGVRNRRTFIAWSTAQLRLLQQERKPVFLVEYLRTDAAIRSARRELEALGFRPVFPTRALDGRDPTDQSIRPGDVGTPEFRARHC
jgi:cysteinyl-tRNA synthetase